MLIGNWKMNPSSPEEAVSLYRRTRTKALKFPGVTVVLCVPYIYIGLLAKKAADKRIHIGGQDISVVEGIGAYTGAVSAELLSKVGARYTIVGHSERRIAGDDNIVVRAKLKSALRAGLFVILCVGETERDSHGRYLTAVKEQVESALRGIDRAEYHKVIIVYEPVWAIGDKALRAATPQDVLEMQIYIHKILADLIGQEIARSMLVLYGGSSDQKNAEEILRTGQVDGLLPGRASLNPEVFGVMIVIADRVARAT